MPEQQDRRCATDAATRRRFARDADLPRPRREYDVKSHAGFADLREHLWNLLREEAIIHAHEASAS